MHIYAFGSICRGEVDLDSDVDLLALVFKYEPKLDPKTFSIYSYDRLAAMWKDGNPFAWHLYLESRLLYKQDGIDYIKSLGEPGEYTEGDHDCRKFMEIFNTAVSEIERNTSSYIFELSNMFLAIRNFATCYSLQFRDKPEFSRYSALSLKEKSLKISDLSYTILERSRILSTRGSGPTIIDYEVTRVMKDVPAVREWMENIWKEPDEN
jgi:hypothetical protein